MDAAQWSQQVASLPRQMEEISSPTPPSNNPNNPTNSIVPTQQTQQAQERSRTRPQKDQNLNCPRCNSTNTKFCYYNNYSLTQPRYFCKTCRRYWTQGGSLRSVPVGGGSRKNKRSSSSSMLTSPQPPPSSTTNPQPMHNKLLIPDLNPPTSLSHLLTSSQNPNIKFLEGHDLNLAFPMQGLFHQHMDHQHHQLPKIEGNNNNNNNENHDISNNNNSSTPTTTPTTPTTPLSALELLRNGIASRGGGLSPFIRMPMQDSSTLYQPGYQNMQEFKPNMNMFSSPPSEHNHMVGSNEHDNDIDNPSGGGARLLFPFADMNKLAANAQQHHHDDHIDDDQTKGGVNDHNHHTGYWSGMLGGGTW